VKITISSLDRWGWPSPGGTPASSVSDEAEDFFYPDPDDQFYEEGDEEYDLDAF
jgi:hypothetical protein